MTSKRPSHSVTPGPQLAKTLCREQAVLFLWRLLDAGMPREDALKRASGAIRFNASTRALRRWEKRYSQGGFTALFENKVGRSGRKPGKADRSR